MRLGAAEQVAASVVEGKVALEKLRGSQTAMEVEGELTQEASRNFGVMNFRETTCSRILIIDNNSSTMGSLHSYLFCC